MLLNFNPVIYVVGQRISLIYTLILVSILSVQEIDR